ncbi:MAG: amino-acid N-acetyltransferase [Puniceicoccaceae bacterium MED-G30]|jgi:amino-acid N-acetyltransferase|nr:MAG: amino-acid N-acetyltransferase [Puniceicoccaceae bacterium MED-G30]
MEKSLDKAIKPTDLRGILEYVPMFRGHVFIIALDGSLVAHDMFPDVLLDIAVLRSLNIKVVLVHGIGHQLQALASARDTVISNPHGEGATDQTTLELATEASATVNLQIIRGLTKNKLRCAATNAVRGKQIGIIQGIDQQLSGDVDKLDTSLISQLLENHTVPVVSPIAFDRDGGSLRLNSDLLAAELADRLDASKLIYLGTQDGLQIDGEAVKNLPVAKLERLLEKDSKQIPDRTLSKARYSASAVRAGTPRAHLLDGRVFGALLNEIFDKVGVGTMVYGNEYESIRSAVETDAHSIHNITRNGVQTESLRERSLDEILSGISNFLVYEIDGSIVGCLQLLDHENGKIIEIGSVYVQSFYQQKGVGRRLIEYASSLAAERGVSTVIALSTRAADFFIKVCGFREGSVEDLPQARMESYQNEGRRSKILLKNI